MAQHQAVFSAAGEHPVGLLRAQGRKVVYEHPDIRLVPAQHQPFASGALHRRVDPRHEPLGSCLLVAGTAVGLPRGKEPLQALGFQGGIEVQGVQVVVLHRIGGPDDPGLLQTGDAADKFTLYVFGKGAGSAVHVHLAGGKPLRFDKDMVPFPLREADHLVLDGGTVPGPRAGDLPAVEGGTVYVPADDLVGLGSGVGDPAGNQRPVQGRTGGGIKGEGPGRFAVLPLHPGVVDGIPRKPGRRAGLEPPQGKAPLPQPRPQAQGGLLAQPALGRVVLADEDFSFHECSCGEDDRRGGDAAPPLGDYPFRPLPVMGDQEVRNGIHEDFKPRLIFHHSPGGGLVGGLVRLGPGRLHRRPP